MCPQEIGPVFPPHSLPFSFPYTFIIKEYILSHILGLTTNQKFLLFLSVFQRFGCKGLWSFDQSSFPTLRRLKFVSRTDTLPEILIRIEHGEKPSNGSSSDSDCYNSCFGMGNTVEHFRNRFCLQPHCFFNCLF